MVLPPLGQVMLRALAVALAIVLNCASGADDAAVSKSRLIRNEVDRPRANEVDRRDLDQPSTRIHRRVHQDVRPSEEKEDARGLNNAAHTDREPLSWRTDDSESRGSAELEQDLSSRGDNSKGETTKSGGKKKVGTLCEPAQEAIFIQKTLKDAKGAQTVLRFPIGWPPGIFSAEKADCLDDCKVLDHIVNLKAFEKRGYCSSFSTHHEPVSLATQQQKRCPSDDEKPLDYSLCCVVRTVPPPPSLVGEETASAQKETKAGTSGDLDKKATKAGTSSDLDKKATKAGLSSDLDKEENPETSKESEAQRMAKHFGGRS